MASRPECFFKLSGAIAKRFPPDFMFQLTKKEFANWRSQIVISNPSAKMGLRRRPYAFTEHGAAMVAAVLHSKQAVGVSISIVRTFVKLRRVLAENEEVRRKLLEHDQQIAVLFDHVRELIEPPPTRKKNFGFLPARSG